MIFVKNYEAVNIKKLFPLLFVLVSFFISRFIYHQVGIKFQGDTYLVYWQFIDVKLLHTDLWRNVFYLHSQPPLLNLFTGVILQGFPSIHGHVFNGIFYLAALTLAVNLYFLGNFTGLNSWVSAFLSILFVISPSTILYENLLSYAFITTTIMTFSAVFLYKFVETKGTVWGMAFFFMLAILTLTWSLFHIIWLFTITIFIFVLLRKNRRQVLTAAFIPLLLTTSWYGKNSLLYGEFTASSWGGMNLANVTTFRLSEEERNLLQKSGELSEMATIPTFRNPKVYLEVFPHTSLTGIPVLDETEPRRVNRHHLVYVEASRDYLGDALKVIHLYPFVYLESIWQSGYIYFHSPSDSDFLYGNLKEIQVFDTWWNRLVYGQWNSGETLSDRMTAKSVKNVGWMVVIATAFSMAWCVHYLYKNIIKLTDSQNMLIFFMLYNIVFVTVIGNMMELGENNRFRFSVDPFIMCIFAFSIKGLLNANKNVSINSG
jgi:hypothetical protein